MLWWPCPKAVKDRGFELKQVASGYRFQVRQELAPWVGRLWEEKPQRYTRALLETLGTDCLSPTHYPR